MCLRSLNFLLHLRRPISSYQWKISSIVIDDEGSSDEEQPRPLPKATTVKKKRSTLGNPDAKDDQGLLLDVEVQSIEHAPCREDKRRDVDQFFHRPLVREVMVNQGDIAIVDEVTTLRRHLEASHIGKYRLWAKSANFESKLPGDVKKRKAAMAVVPINIFEHPKFKFMIEVSSQATRGICVKIPSGKTTRAEIKRMFGKTMMDLKQRLSCIKMKSDGRKQSQPIMTKYEPWLKLLQHADHAQQAFSSEKIPSLYLGIVVEALQSLKCAIRTNLIFREPGPSTISEGYEEDDGENDSEDEEGWDSLVIDAEADDADNDAEDADNDD
ncbi:hypothetical protein JOM56_001734 [Amanita muscaria]